MNIAVLSETEKMKQRKEILGTDIHTINLLEQQKEY